ncbi:MAG: 16S rRNA (adenine(1518)-N(6)/adenine(1519)-N(6))-dimethyltransferase RsmA [Candidatus Promineifilaceae bacterium]
MAEHPKHALTRHGIRAKKSLGQNFLFDDNILGRLVAAAVVRPEETVLEIGAGLGDLTLYLAAAGAQVVAVELDERLFPILQERLGGLHTVRLVRADILELRPADYFGPGYKVVANVPYYITGAILRHLLSAAPRPERLLLTLQKEVAERMAAEPGEMSLLAATTQYYGRVKVLFTIPAGAFWPRPKIDSAAVEVRLWPEPKLSPKGEEAAFLDLLRLGFAQKRKQLRNNLLAAGWERPAVEAALSQAGLAGRRRAETLSLEEWLALFAAIGGPPAPAEGPLT